MIVHNCWNAVVVVAAAVGYVCVYVCVCVCVCYAVMCVRICVRVTFSKGAITDCNQVY